MTVASVLGQVALSLLELFVAFLQAYIFTFLTALFMGMAMHPRTDRPREESGPTTRLCRVIESCSATASPLMGEPVP